MDDNTLVGLLAAIALALGALVAMIWAAWER
jgi:hypothetical protein